MRIALAVAFLAVAAPATAECRFPAEPVPGLGVAFDEDGLTPRAWYFDPTEEYQHGVLGDAIEGTRLQLVSPRAWGDCGVLFAWAGKDHVFEDTAPRLADFDGDGISEVITVRTSMTEGAQVVVYAEPSDPMENGFPNMMVPLAQSPYIGKRNRWLAPIGAADLDGDGAVEIAYIDRPHLAKTLRIVSINGDALVEDIAGAGFTNHRIGETDIAGGIRDCGSGPEMIVASADWSQLIAVRYDGENLAAREIGRDTTRPAFARAMDCN